MRVLLLVVLFSITCIGYAQPPILSVETESAPCGGKGKIFFNALVPELYYKISFDNGKSYSRLQPDAEGKVMFEKIPGRYDVIILNEYGRKKGEINVATEGKLPSYTLSQKPSICGEIGAVVVSGLDEGQHYRISTNNGESYKHLSANDSGVAELPAYGGVYDVLVANQCGFTKQVVMVANEGNSPEFTIETTPSQCGEQGSIILGGLDAGWSFDISLDNGEHYHAYKANEEGKVTVKADPGSHSIIVRTACGTSKSEASIISEGSAPNFTLSSEMEGEWSKEGTIIISGLTELVLFQVSVDNGETYSFVASDENGDIRRDVDRGSYSVIVKNKCGSSTGKVSLGEGSTFTGNK